MSSFAGAAVTLGAGALVMLVYLLATQGRPALAVPRRHVLAFVPVGVLFGLSYACLFEAYYRGRVRVVSPLVATESLWGVALSALVVRGELVGARLVAGAVLIVLGGVVIGVTR